MDKAADELAGVAVDGLLLPRCERDRPLMCAAEPVLLEGVPPELVGTWTTTVWGAADLDRRSGATASARP
jgi:hypothetical protein